MMKIKTILYAEDNPDDLVILEMACKRAALPVALLNVEDGEEAINWLRGKGKYADRTRHPIPDVLILDLKMPKKSGFDVLEWLRQQKEPVQPPVIILSSSDDPRDLKRAAQLGATSYFFKTADCQKVVDYLRMIS